MRFGWLLVSSCVTTMGCSEVVTRHVTVSPSEAEALGRSHVVHLAAATDKPDSVVVDVEYKPGDEIPGEGVVRRATDETLAATGVVMMLAGTGFLIGGVWWSTQPSVPWDMSGNVGIVIAGPAMSVGGGLLALAGLGLTIAGITPRIDKKVTLTPTVGRGVGGGMFELHF